MPESLPPDRKCDVVEEIATTSQKAAASDQNLHTQTHKSSDRKRKKLDNIISPINVDLSEQTERLTNHDDNDQNRYSILGVLGDLEIETTQRTSKPNTQIPTSTEKPKLNKKSWCPPIFIPSL